MLTDKQVAKKRRLIKHVKRGKSARRRARRTSGHQDDPGWIAGHLGYSRGWSCQPQPGGRDKAWLQRSGVPQVLRLAGRFTAECGAVLVSANANLERYAEHGLCVVRDLACGVGPLGGLQALVNATTTPWLLTLPVDLIGTNECLLRTMAKAADAGAGAVAEDDDGLQPLVALYRIEPLRVRSRLPLPRANMPCTPCKRGSGWCRLVLRACASATSIHPKTSTQPGSMAPERPCQRRVG